MSKEIGSDSPVEAVVPFPGVARQVLGADPVVGTVEPSLEVGKQDMDDRHEAFGVLAFALDERVVAIGAVKSGVTLEIVTGSSSWLRTGVRALFERT